MGACFSSPSTDGDARLKSPKGASAIPLNVAANAAPQTTPKAGADAQTTAVKHRQMAKRIAVAAEAIANASDVEIPTIPKTTAVRSLIEKAMKGNLLFQGLSLGARQAIVNSMTAQSVCKNDVIITQGDTEANKYYVIERGSFKISIEKDGNKQALAKCGPGTGFGELALLYSAPRAATVIAAEDGKLWAMERAVYLAIKRSFAETVSKQRRALLDAVPMLAMLAPEHKAAVAEVLELVEYGDCEHVFLQGEPGDRFYTIQEGSVNVIVDGKQVTKLSEGAYFGERALLTAEPRAATIVSDGYVACFSLSRQAFNDLLGPIEDLWRYEALRKVPILSNLSEKQLFELARSLTTVEFAAEQVVFREGDVGDSFYIVEEGEFSVTDASGKELARCSKGQCFGELALLRSEPRAATVIAAGAAKALACTKHVFDAHLGTLSEIRNLWRFEALRKVPLLAGLTQQQRLALCTAFVSTTFTSQQTIVSKGEEGDEFFVVEKGECAAYGDDGQELGRLGPTAYFGERALLRNEPRAATVKAIVDSSLLRLGRKDFERLLGSVQEVLQQQAATYDAALATQKIHDPLKFEDFEQVAVLGAGAFGRVTLVRYQGRYYALKALSKAHVVSSGLTTHIKREKDLQAQFASPFLVSLVAAFQDNASLYMVLEVVQGGEFFSYLQSRNDATLPESEARFYAACVVLGLEYMHDRQVAWRDLKPENLLLDSAGYLKITDFGFAKRISSTSKSYTLCGTPEYLAPELVTQVGHTRAVDWWAVGVLVYEMVAGFPPFHQEDRVTMFRAICAAQYTMPSHFSPELQDLISRLLVKVPNRRLGYAPGGITEVKRHPWFAGFDWDALAQRKLKPPFVPKISSSDDASNFQGDAVISKRQGDDAYVSMGAFKDF